MRLYDLLNIIDEDANGVQVWEATKDEGMGDLFLYEGNPKELPYVIAMEYEPLSLWTDPTFNEIRIRCIRRPQWQGIA